MNHANLPFHLYVRVPNWVITDGKVKGFTRGIWWGVYSRLGQHVMTNILLETGANWTGVAVKDVCLDEGEDVEELGLVSDLPLFPWTAMGNDIYAFHAEYLEGLMVTDVRKNSLLGRHTGIVLDWSDGFSRYPAEHKPLNLIASKEHNGFGLLPNNFCQFQDKHFVVKGEKTVLKDYRRGDQVFWE